MRTKEQIAKNNDLFRTTMIATKFKRLALSEMVADSPDREAVIAAVRAFNDFNKGSNPHGEHDFGQVVVNGQNYFFKFDYYDLNYQYGADPYDENHALLLTIMRDDEY